MRKQGVGVVYMTMILVFSPFLRLPEPEPLPDLLRKDPRPALLHGGPVGRGYEDLDGRDRHRSRGIHTVHELRETQGRDRGHRRRADRFGRDSPITDSTGPPCFWSAADAAPCFMFHF